MQLDVFLQIGASTKGSGTVWTWVRLLTTVCASVLRESGCHAETLAANPAAERTQAAVDALVVLQMGELAEALATSGALEGPLISMGPHVNLESRIVRKLLVASRTAEARSISGLVECSLEMGQHVLLQCTVGDEAATAGLHWAFQRRLTSVGQPMQVQALLGHAAVTTKVTLNLPSGASPSLASSPASTSVVLGRRAPLQVNF